MPPCAVVMEPSIVRSHGKPDGELLAECEVRTTRASGPGGRRRDTTETAVRIVHLPTGIEAVASERRSQAENRGRALKRLRKKLALQVRAPFRPWGQPPTAAAIPLRMAESNPSYPGLVADVLDALESASGRISDAAKALGASTGRLSAFLEKDKDLFEAANRIRERHGCPRLRRR